MADFDLNGKVAVISGASRGIGEAIARRFAAAGANVVIGSRRAENIQPVAKAINADHPGQAVAAVAHAGKSEDDQ